MVGKNPIDLEELAGQPEGTIRFGVDEDGYAWEYHVCEGVPYGGVLDGRWTVESSDPLTVRPSIQCGACGLHGFIVNGVWRPV